MSRKRATPRDRGSHSTRDLILDAAERSFAERGFASVSVRELAAEAGLKNQASLYNHFRNKRALYEAVLARGVDPIAQVVAESANASATRSWEQVETFLDRVVDYLADHPHVPRLIQRAALDDGNHLRGSLHRLLRPLYSEGMRVLANVPGTWQRADLPHVAAGLYQLIFGYFANAALLETVVEGDPLSPTALARQRRFLKAAVTQLLRGALDAEAGDKPEKHRTRVA
jgi:TetR/AcrR family transcriptional regulator